MATEVVVFLGTRPELTKMACVLKELEKQSLDFKFVFSGQHYDFNMSKIFFEEFELPEPDECLDIGGVTETEQLSLNIKKSMEYLKKESPKIAVVNGDTNTTLMSGLAVARTSIPLVHVEAGCRSFDLAMPEEVNRLVVDRLGSLLFPATKACKENLLAEGIIPERIGFTGNTIVDVYKTIKKHAKQPELSFDVEKDGFVLVTVHRKENADNPENLRNILKGLADSGREVIFPIHPRTAKNVKKFRLNYLLEKKNIHVIEPVGYFEFLWLMKQCRMVFTDSGGVVGECALVKKRVLIPRSTLEWYEIYETGIGKLVRKDSGLISRCVNEIYEKGNEGIPEVYPDVNASKNIVKDIKEYIEGEVKLNTDFFEEGRPRVRLNKGKKWLTFDKKRYLSEKKEAREFVGIDNERLIE